MAARSYISRRVALDNVNVRRPQRRFTEELFGDMPRYFFHVKRGQVTVLDQDGIELPSLEDAAREALRRAQELALRTPTQDTTGKRRMIIIADSEWRTMIEVPF
jgi:hypothetical protein